MRGIRKREAAAGRGIRECLPVTPSILRALKEVWSPTRRDRDTKLIWAMCCLCFFGFMRAGELSVPSDGAYDPTVHLSVADLALDCPWRPSFVRVRIMQSKTDPFHKGIDLFVGATGNDLCPVTAVLDFLQERGTEPGPLFLFADDASLRDSAL